MYNRVPKTGKRKALERSLRKPTLALQYDHGMSRYEIIRYVSHAIGISTGDYIVQYLTNEQIIRATEVLNSLLKEKETHHD